MAIFIVQINALTKKSQGEGERVKPRKIGIPT